MNWEDRIAQITQQRPAGSGLEQSASPTHRLPRWPDTERGVPNAILRSALFAASTKGARRYVEREHIHSLGDISILHTGPCLGQGELDVWESVLHLARVSGRYPEIRTSIYQLLKLQGKTDAGSNCRLLHNRLVRLKASVIEIKHGQYSYMGSLIDEAFRDEGTEEYVIRLNPNLCNLFAEDAFTHVDWQVRRALSGKSLAQWLHGFYSSHAKAFSLSIGKLMRLAGSSDQSPGSSEQNLRRALNALAMASSLNGQPFSYSINNRKVHIDRHPTQSQLRHLRNKAAKPKTTRVKQCPRVP
ncbi:TPA: TrfA protein [Pseudomonas aeruginosa]|nr:TrfA protein [Pseudomonas aeruginosa]